MRSSRVAPASDGLHARLYPLGSHAGGRPQLVDCSSGCSRKTKQSAAFPSSSSTPRSESSEQAEASSASTLPALERLRRRCPGPSAEHSLLPFCLARPRSPRRYRSLPLNLFSISAPDRIARPYTTKYNEVPLFAAALSLFCLSLLRFSRRYRSLTFCLSPRRYSPTFRRYSPTFRRSDDRRHIIYTLHTPPTPHHTPKQQSTHG